MARFCATTDPKVCEREIHNQKRSRRIAAEGMVLLENNGILPLPLEGRRIALFGSGARHTVHCGIGSGEVNTRTVTSVEQGLENAGAVVTTKAWLDRYDQAAEAALAACIADTRKKYADNPEMAFWAMFAYRNPLTVPLMDSDCAESDGGIAIYVLSRNSGEGSDRRLVPGDYLLHPEETAFIQALGQHYPHLILVLNVGGVIDTAFLRSQPGIDAILLMSQTGSTGGDALADVLSGKVTPCGHLAATWAEKYADYPSSDTFGHMNGNIDDEYYREGMYVGYRWFDAFGIAPTYPFGYGLSYTTFSLETVSLSVKDHADVVLEVNVTNTGGSFSGREVVQVYASAPEGEMDQPYQTLVAFAKSKELAPGESETLTLSFPLGRMASWHEPSASWILENGDYLLRVGTHSRSTRVAGILRMKQRFVYRELSPVLPLDCEMECARPDRQSFPRYPEEVQEIREAKVVEVSDIRTPEAPDRDTLPAKQTPNPSFLTMEDVLSGACTAEELVRQLTVPELASLCVGSARDGFEASSTIGAASLVCPGAAGDTTSELLETRGIRKITLADGPAGLRLSPSFTVDQEEKLVHQAPALGSGFFEAMFGNSDTSLPEGTTTYYQYCTGIPTATLLAQTWDMDALRTAGDIVGSEMEAYGITLWLAPGMNIQRNPLCGRNFEYYSEDPLLSGLCAAADTQGVQSHPGVGTTIKHFACNNLEDNRAYNNSHVTERALREIYLRGFEIAVETAQPMAIMSSYNMINGIHTANACDLLTKVAREEWGFSGIIMTDWGTTQEPKPDLNGRMPVYGCSSAAGCIRAGNDLIMPGSQGDIDEIIASVNAPEGTVRYPLTMDELRTCASRVIRIIARSNAYESSVPYTDF